MRRFLLPILLVALAAPALAGDEIFRLTDPRGDDHGDGDLRYPTDYYGIRKGDLDLVGFAARHVDGATEFEATFAQPVRPTGRRTIDIGGTSLDSVARFGFYTTNIDIYIDTDHVPGSGGLVTLPGRRAELLPENAWEKAIILTPRPFEARATLKDILLRSLKRQLNARGGNVSREDAERIKAVLPDDLDTHVFFPTRIRVTGRTIRFQVPDQFLGGPARADWGYVIFVTGADIDLRFAVLPPSVGKASDEDLMVLPISPGGATDHFGGGREDDDLQTPIVDLLVPPGMKQEDILRSDDPAKGIPVRLPAIIPARLAGAEKH